jgi:oxygen-independent coproporphyrinogen-3 oxidase
MRATCAGGKQTIDTVYIGGGTPSVIDSSQMRDIMGAIEKSFEIKPDAEITIEANPGTLGKGDSDISAKLTAYKEMGFNRLSMGVQSMDDERLKFLGRIHSADEVERDVKLAREAGFDNINLDLIFSVPGESTEDALSDARNIIELGPEHISCYSLQIEEETPLAEQVEKGILTEVPDEEDRETYHKMCALLKDAGYEHYEISNFARSQDATGFGMNADVASKSPFRSKHNSLYWDMSDYIACGLGASGFTGGVRYKNLSDIDEYMHSITDKAVLPVEEEYENTSFDNISEAVFTGLRRREGITYEEACRAYMKNDCNEETQSDAEEFFWKIFADAKKEAAEFARQGFLIIDEKGLRLTEQGIDISNQIMALFV